MRWGDGWRGVEARHKGVNLGVIIFLNPVPGTQLNERACTRCKIVIVSKMHIKSGPILNSIRAIVDP